MTAREKYEALEVKKEKLVIELQSLYAKIDVLRVKINQIELEAQDAYRKLRQEIKLKQ